MTLEQTLEREQEFQVNKLIRRIERLEAETVAKQQVLEQVSVCILLSIFLKELLYMINLSPVC